MADKITQNADGELNVSDNPIIPFIEGDGIGVDIWPASKLVMDAAAKKHGKTIEWKEVLAGQKAFDETGEWLPGQPGTRGSTVWGAKLGSDGSPRRGRRVKGQGRGTAWRVTLQASSVTIPSERARNRPDRKST